MEKSDQNIEGYNPYRDHMKKVFKRSGCTMTYEDLVDVQKRAIEKGKLWDRDDVPTTLV